MLAVAVLGNFGLLPKQIRVLVSALALAVPIVWSILARRKSPVPTHQRNLLLPCFLYVLALCVPFLVSFKRPIFWAGRYDIIALPFFALLLTALLLSTPPRPRYLFQFVLAASCCLYFVTAVHRSQTSRFLRTLDPVPLDDRAAARQICSEAKRGDYVIYTGLSRAAVGFYLERFGCAREVNQVSYPAELEQHLGWENPKRAYSWEPALKQQGEAAAEDAYASGHRVFLLFDKEKRLSAGIVSPLEQRFRILSTHGFVSCRPCFDELRVYAPCPERPGTPVR
jgi:hypothetical protein